MSLITHGTQAIVFGNEDVIRTEDLILNISINDLVEDMEADKPSLYTEVLNFLNKVSIYDL